MLFGASRGHLQHAAKRDYVVRAVATGARVEATRRLVLRAAKLPCLLFTDRKKATCHQILICHCIADQTLPRGSPVAHGHS